MSNDAITEDALSVVKRLGQGDYDVEEGDIVSAIEVYDNALSTFEPQLGDLLRKFLSKRQEGNTPNLTPPDAEPSVNAPRHSGGGSQVPPLPSSVQAEREVKAELDPSPSSQEISALELRSLQTETKLAALIELVQKFVTSSSGVKANGNISPMRDTGTTHMPPTTIGGNSASQPKSSAFVATKPQYLYVGTPEFVGITQSIEDLPADANNFKPLRTNSGIPLLCERDVLIAVEQSDTSIELAAQALCRKLGCQDELALSQISDLLQSIRAGVLEVDDALVPTQRILNKAAHRLKSDRDDELRLRSFDPFDRARAQEMQMADLEFQDAIRASQNGITDAFHRDEIDATELAQLLKSSKANLEREYSERLTSYQANRQRPPVPEPVPSPKPPDPRCASPDTPATSFVLIVDAEPTSELSGKDKRNDINTAASKELIDSVRKLINIVNPGTSNETIKLLLDEIQLIATADCRLRSPHVLGLHSPLSQSYANGHLGTGLAPGKGSPVQHTFATGLLALLYGLPKSKLVPAADGTFDEIPFGDFAGTTGGESTSDDSSTDSASKLGNMYLNFIPSHETQHEAIADGEREILEGKFAGILDDQNILHIRIDGATHSELLRVQAANVRVIRACLVVFGEQSKDMTLPTPIRNLVYQKLVDCKKYLDEPDSIDALGVQTSCRFTPPANVPPNPFLNILVRIAHAKNIEIFGAANIIQGFMILRSETLDMNVKWTQSLFPNKLLHAVIQPNQSPLDFLTSLLRFRDELNRVHMPVSLEALGWTVADGERHPLFTDKFIVWQVAFNVWSELAVTRGQINTRSYVDKATFKLAKEGRLSIPALREILEAMAKDGIGNPVPQPKPPPPPPRPTAAAPVPAPAAAPVGSGAFVSVGTAPTGGGAAASSPSILDDAILRAYNHFATEWSRNNTKTLLTFVRSLQTFGKKHNAKILDGPNNKEGRFAPTALRLTQGDWTKLTHSPANTDASTVALFHMISDLAGGTKSLSAVGQAFARANPTSHWKIRMAHDAKRNDEHLWLK